MIMRDLIETHINYKLLLTNDNNLTQIVIVTSAAQDHVRNLSTKNNSFKEGVGTEVNKQCEVAIKETTSSNKNVVLSSKKKSFTGVGLR